MEIKAKRKTSRQEIKYPQLKDRHKFLQDLMDSMPDVIYFKL